LLAAGGTKAASWRLEEIGIAWAVGMVVGAVGVAGIICGGGPLGINCDRGGIKGCGGMAGIGSRSIKTSFGFNGSANIDGAIAKMIMLVAIALKKLGLHRILEFLLTNRKTNKE